MSPIKRRLLEVARRTIRAEAEAVADLEKRIGAAFGRALEAMLQCRGKVVVTGMGKSGLVGQKIASTLASTGTSAFFLHSAEAAHGDVGMVRPEDVVLALSYSGETRELLDLLPTFKLIKVPLIAITGNTDSTLAKRADVVLDAQVAREACPLNLAPTSSTTAALALGDALAVALLEARGFKEQDFATLHPGGALGKRLLLKVSDLMRTGDELPRVGPDAKGTDVLMEMSAKRLGITGVFDERGRLIGCVSDGDLRRGLQRLADKFIDTTAAQMMTKGPKTIEADALAARALRTMEDNNITVLFVTASPRSTKIVGALHLHDILKAGLI
ncbi:MAG: KpsF/GutQ family sugar-phosphate isomerase [Candidatus Alcyoniella australis]|nr:KpsF/GutQ family sugar-phosphate isomerase [Candidatus Alcyoniella australis]